MPSFAFPPALQNLPPLLLVAAVAVLAVYLGGLLARRLPWTGGTLRVLGNLVLVGVLVLTAMRFVRLDPQFDALMPRFGMPVQSVAGGETRVPLSADGHYWIEATVNGSTQRFMVDTGATLSALSVGAARDAGVEPDPLRLPVLVRTAGGTTRAELAHVEDLRFGNIVAKDLDAIITGDTGGLNVLGMNFLSRLKGWRVEDGVLILTPSNDPAAGASS
jgi:aspartyl protease family protein